MRLNVEGVQVFFVFIFLAVVTNIFLSGFNESSSDLSVSGFFFYLLIFLVLCLHLIIGRVDFIFISGCIITVCLKFLPVPAIVSDTLMILVIAWGISYVRQDLTRLHFNLIFIYGLMTTVVGILQVAGVEQLHLWNTLMTDERGLIDSSLARSLISTPISLIEQSQIRPPGLFHSNAVLSMFVCYFYALLLQKSLRFLPLGLMAVWICGSKITFLFALVFPLLMKFQKESLPRYFFLKVYFSIFVFFLVMFLLFPGVTERRYSVDSFLFAVLLRSVSIDQFANLGIDFAAMSVFEGSIDAKDRSNDMLSGIFGFIAIIAPLMLFGLRRSFLLFSKHIAGFSTFFIVSLATAITGNPFFIFIMYPIFVSLRAKRI
tara:strand:+ start:1425 stop:2546 length:1122 start_codon:yes stop_codon:yes gene_type:complete